MTIITTVEGISIPGCDPEATVPSVDVVSVVLAGRCRRLALTGYATDEADDAGAWDTYGSWSSSAGAVAADADRGGGSELGVVVTDLRSLIRSDICTISKGYTHTLIEFRIYKL
ncbi:unnamed protein product [Prunus armeniaca]